MRYKVKNMAALDMVLAGLPNQTRVEVDPDIGLSAKTVGELRKLKDWPHPLAITVPEVRTSEMAIYVSKPTVATRVSPKP